MKLNRKVIERGDEPPTIGPAMHKALGVLIKFPGGKEPPKGTVTARDEVRPHVFSDMVPLGLAAVKVQKDSVLYEATPLGRWAFRHCTVAHRPMPKGRRRRALK